MRAKNLGLILVLLVGQLCPDSASAITYTFNRTIGDGSVTGTFKTDGTLGIFTNDAHFTSASMTIVAPNMFNGNPISDSWPGGGPIFMSGSVTATATELIFDLSQSGYFGFWLSATHWWCLDSTGAACLAMGEVLGYADGGQDPAQSESRSGQFVFATASTTEVPLPAALPIFVAGIGVLVTVARCKKKRSMAVA